MHRAKAPSQQRFITTVCRAWPLVWCGSADSAHSSASIPIRRFGGVLVARRACGAPRVTDHVLLIFRAGAPRKVDEAIIRRDVVEVPPLGATRARTNECLQDEVVNEAHLSPRPLGEHDVAAPILTTHGALQDAATPTPCAAIFADRDSILGPDLAPIRNRVQALPSDDGQPAFIDHTETVTNFADRAA